MESPLCPDGHRLIETFGWDGTAFRRLDAHLARARASAATLGFRWDQTAIDAALAPIGGAVPLRVRLTIGKDGDAEAATGPLAPNAAEWRLAIASDRLDAGDPLLRHKTTARHLYDATRANLPDGIDEAVFLNRRGEVCEGTITNIFFDLGGGLATPPLASGCLPGILRAELLATGRATEAILRGEDLPRARLWMGNALRGLIPARLA